MKRNLICLLLASMFAAPLFAQSAPPGGNAQAFLAFTGGSVWNDTQTGGTCIWYFPVLGNLPLTSLFASEKGSPVVDLNHAYFVWISGWSIQWEAESPGFGSRKVTLAGIAAGTAPVSDRSLLIRLTPARGELRSQRSPAAQVCSKVPTASKILTDSSFRRN